MKSRLFFFQYGNIELHYWQLERRLSLEFMLIFAEICSGKGVQVKAPLDMIRGIARELSLQYQLVLFGAGRIAVFFSATMAQVAHAITFIPGARLKMLPLWIIYRHFKI